ncbi:MAG TPA: glycerol-3-phosphate acyltransferase [Ktedonobacterales bacterium]|nr:glycerol-3-phosphate acyltransferase [Ktedonobacterales bacterium]
MLILWLILCYLSGALPWSVWLGKRFFRVDPREQHDHNPGAANAFRAAGWRLGVVVLVLDFFKAFIPVVVARWLLGFPSDQLLWLAFMPTLGHAFSVFLRFRGGRGIVVMFGVWAGLTLYQIPIVMGLTAIGGVFLLKKDEYRTLAIPLVLIAYLLLTRAPDWMVLLAVTQLIILVAKIGAFVIQQRAQTGPKETETK